MDFDKAIEAMAAEAEAARKANSFQATDEQNTESAQMMIAKDYQPLNQELFKRLAGYYTGYRLGMYKKGIAMFGDNGIGKTYFLNRILRVKMYRCKYLVDIYRDNRQLFDELLRRGAGQYDVIPQSHLELSIDEVGEEQPLNDFGNKYEIFTDTLQVRHHLFESYGAKTHFTSNLTKDEFRERYGTRCLSRMNQMCYLLETTGRDLR